MRIIVNGKEKELPGGVTVAGLLEALGLSDKRVAVELNRAIVAREDYGDTPVSDGDAVEILSFVGGG